MLRFDVFMYRPARAATVLSTKVGIARTITAAEVGMIRATKPAAAVEQGGATEGHGDHQVGGAEVEVDGATSRMGEGGRPLTLKATVSIGAVGILDEPAEGGGGEAEDGNPLRGEGGSSAASLEGTRVGVEGELAKQGVARCGDMRMTMTMWWGSDQPELPRMRL